MSKFCFISDSMQKYVPVPAPDLALVPSFKQEGQVPSRCKSATPNLLLKIIEVAESHREEEPNLTVEDVSLAAIEL